MALDLGVLGAVRQGRMRKYGPQGGMSTAVPNGALAGQVGQSQAPRASLSPQTWGQVSGAIGSVLGAGRQQSVGGFPGRVGSSGDLSAILGGTTRSYHGATNLPTPTLTPIGVAPLTSPSPSNIGVATPSMGTPQMMSGLGTGNPGKDTGIGNSTQIYPSTVDPNQLWSLFQNGVLGPQQAMSEIDRTNIMNQLGLSNAASSLSTTAMTTDAQAQQDRLGLSRERLGINANALNRQGPLSQAQQDINRQFIGIQGENIAGTEAKYREDALRAFRGEESRALQTGGLFTEGHTQNKADIQFDLNHALAGIDRAKRGLDLTGRQSELSFAETIAQQADAKKQLGIMSRALDIDERDLDNKLSQALQQIGLGQAMTTNQLLSELGKIELGQFSPISGFIDQILGVAGLNGYVPGGQKPSGNYPSNTAISKPKGMNGRLSADSLVSIGGSHRLIPQAANAWSEMKAAAAKDGILLTVTDSYRDYDTQVRTAQKKGLYSKGGLAAEPGKSNHGWGLAVDVGDGKQRDWLRQNAGRFGFKTIPREPWHWEFGGGSHAGHNHK